MEAFLISTGLVALAEIGDKSAVDALIAAVRDSNVEVRRRAVIGG